jgi:hypothetical protein
MSDLEKDIQDLREKTNENRRQFLQTDLQTCFIGIEKAKLELSLGNTHEAEKEFVIASRGADEVERFLRHATVKMPEIESTLVSLRSSLESLRAELDTGTL